jgi:hydroxymethylpyrimidine pyrophosphatase-like HAD family hydrolase
MGDISRSLPYASASFGMPPGEVAVIMFNDLPMFNVAVLAIAMDNAKSEV